MERSSPRGEFCNEVPDDQKKKPEVIPGEAPDQVSRLAKIRGLRKRYFIRVDLPLPGLPAYIQLVRERVLQWVLNAVALACNPVQTLSSRTTKPLEQPANLPGCLSEDELTSPIIRPFDTIDSFVQFFKQ